MNSRPPAKFKIRAVDVTFPWLNTVGSAWGKASDVKPSNTTAAVLNGTPSRHDRSF
ncbi:MAG: hypothetical protein ACE5I3_04290 [Phycisphaerae bacterium]